jgi:hypothetical protein
MFTSKAILGDEMEFEFKMWVFLPCHVSQIYIRHPIYVLSHETSQHGSLKDRACVVHHRTDELLVEQRTVLDG